MLGTFFKCLDESPCNLGKTNVVRMQNIFKSQFLPGEFCNLRNSGLANTKGSSDGDLRITGGQPSKSNGDLFLNTEKPSFDVDESRGRSRDKILPDERTDIAKGRLRSPKEVLERIIFV